MITRRRVLAALAGGGAAAMLPRWPARAGTPLRVAIIGGGLAGLNALDRLRGRGVEAVLYEARNAIGGRLRSVQGVFAPDYSFDEGAQLVNSDHEDVIQLVRRFRLRLVDRRGFGDFHELQIGAGGASVSEADLANELRSLAAGSPMIRIGWTAIMRPSRGKSTLCREQYLDLHGLAAGEARNAIEASIRTEYGAEPDQASALELLFNLPTVDGERLSRISLSDERYLVSGGTDQIARALANQHQSVIRPGHRLAAIDLAGPAPRLAFADGSEAVADRVILALPAPLLRDIRIEGPLPPLWRALIEEVNLGRNEKLIVGYDRQSWRDQIGFGGAIWGAQDFAAIWDAASLAPRPGPGALCYFLGGDQVDRAASIGNAELAARFTAMARTVLPGLPDPNGRFRRTRWGDDPLTGGAYVNFRPGQISRFGSLFTTEEERDRSPEPGFALALCRGWLSDAWPGYMNGALQTGRIAADAAMAPALALAA